MNKRLTTLHFPSRSCLGRKRGTVKTYTSSNWVVRVRQNCGIRERERVSAEGEGAGERAKEGTGLLEVGPVCRKIWKEA